MRSSSMAFHLKSGEDVGRGIERILREQFERIERDARREDAVHAVRKRCKRVRAVMRLLRERCPKFCRDGNEMFRELGRSLSAFRDAKVLRCTMDSLGPEESLGGLRRELPVAPTRGLEAALSRARGVARSARERVEAVRPGEDLGFEAIESALKRSYRRGREAMAVALEHGGDDAFHEWRKRVKDLGYQLQIARVIWPPVLEGWRGELEALGELLGEDHDLVGLRKAVEGCRADSRVLQERIDRRMQEGRAEARLLGPRFFGEKPGSFGRRLRRYRER